MSKSPIHAEIVHRIMGFQLFQVMPIGDKVLTVPSRVARIVIAECFTYRLVLDSLQLATVRKIDHYQGARRRMTRHMS